METGREIIVVVDDDRGMRQSMKCLLSANGYYAQLHASAAEFLAVVHTTKAACLILDIQLGDITGIELARHLIAGGCNTPIVFITGSNDQQFQRDATDLGCVGYLLKPFRAEQLMSVISNAINSGSKLSH